MTYKRHKDGTLEIHIDLDADNCLFRTDDLDYYEEEYLENKGYIYGEFVPIGSKSKKGFHVKKNTKIHKRIKCFHYCKTRSLVQKQKRKNNSFRD